LQALRFENLQVSRVAEKTKRGHAVERRDEPQNPEDKSKQRAGQRQSAIHRREYDVQRGEENDRADAVTDEADESDAKLRLVRKNVARGVDRVARHDERIEQDVIAENYDREREQPGDSGDFRRSAL
jgi:hypothetical protein